MANSLASNTTDKVARVFLKAFDSTRVLSKTVNTQIMEGEFTPQFGETVDFKRPHQYNVRSTTAGDISTNRSDIISGNASGTVQNMLTVPISWTSKNEALDLDQLEEILAPAAEDLCIQLESTLADYMIKNAGTTYGTHGTAVDAWSDVAGAGSMLKSVGAPMTGNSYYVANPFTIQNLADVQNSLSSGSDRLVNTAWENAQTSRNFGGINLITSNAVNTFTNTTAADLVGALSATPTLTYLGAKDTMTQTWAVTGFSADTVVKAGSTIQVTGKYRANSRNGKAIFGADGAQVLWRAVVTADVTLDASGEGDLVVSAAGIYEASGAYNNMTAALASSDVITILGTTAVVYQPNLYYHEQAFGLTTIRQPKLYNTDTQAMTKDGLNIRVSRYSDGNANTQTIRFDLMPAFAVFNPIWAGQAYGL